MPSSGHRIESSHGEASNYAARYARALNARWQPNYRVGVVAGKRFDRLVIQPLVFPSPVEMFGWIERDTGHLIGASSPSNFKDVRRIPHWDLKPGESRDPVVSYRLAEKEEFAAAVIDADVYGSFLHLPRLPYVQTPSLEELRALHTASLRARLLEAEAAVVGIRAELERR
jgi:hypothetical protein